MIALNLVIVHVTEFLRLNRIFRNKVALFHDFHVTDSYQNIRVASF